MRSLLTAEPSVATVGGAGGLTGAQRLVYLNAVLAAGGVVVVVALWATRGQEPYLWWFAVLACATAAALATLASALPRLSPRTTVACFAAIIWSAALASVLLERWTIHFAPLSMLLPVAVAVPVLSGYGFRAIALGAVALTALAMTIGRRTPASPAYDAVGHDVRSLVAVMFVPSIAALLAAWAWRNHSQLWHQVRGLDRSRQRLAEAAEATAHRFERELRNTVAPMVRSVRASVEAMGARDWSDADEAHDHVEQLQGELGRTIDEVRTTAQGIFPPDLAQYGLAHSIEALAVANGLDVTVSDVGDTTLAASTESTARFVLAEVIAETRGSCESDRPLAVDLAVERDGVYLTILRAGAAPDLPHELMLRLSDLVAGIDGTLAVTSLEDGWQLSASLPPIPDEGSNDTDGRADDGGRVAGTPAPARQAMRGGFALAAVASASAYGLALTILAGDGMMSVAHTIALTYLLPVTAAYALARRWPGAAIAVFVAAHWIPAIVVTERVNLIQHFAPVVLMIPMVTAIPYVSGARYAALAAGSAVLAGVTTTVSRVTGSEDFASDSPDWLNDSIVIVFTTLAVLLLVGQLTRGNNQLVADRDSLRTARRRIVTTSDSARRELERNLHDGVQGVLVAVALQLRVLQHRLQAAGLAALESLETLSALAARAESAVDQAATGITPGAVPGDGLCSTLTQLAASTPFPCRVEVSPRGQAHSRDVEDAIYLTCAEALTNIAKHTPAGTRAVVQVTADRDRCRVSVRDTGPGMGSTPGTGTGISNMRQRAIDLGGSLDIESSATGLTVRMSLPTDASAPSRSGPDGAAPIQRTRTRAGT